MYFRFPTHIMCLTGRDGVLQEISLEIQLVKKCSMLRLGTCFVHCAVLHPSHGRSELANFGGGFILHRVDYNWMLVSVLS